MGRGSWIVTKGSERSGSSTREAANSCVDLRLLLLLWGLSDTSWC